MWARRMHGILTTGSMGPRTKMTRSHLPANLSPRCCSPQQQLQQNPAQTIRGFILSSGASPSACRLKPVRRMAVPMVLRTARLYTTKTLSIKSPLGSLAAGIPNGLTATSWTRATNVRMCRLSSNASVEGRAKPGENTTRSSLKGSRIARC